MPPSKAEQPDTSVSKHVVGSEEWNCDLSDVILPLPTYDSDSSDSEDGQTNGRKPVARKLETWEEISPHQVMDMMRSNAKHGHCNRELHKKPRPPQIPGVAGVRHLTESDARLDLAAIIGGLNDHDIGEPVIIYGLADGWRANERWCSAEAFVEHYGDMPLKVHELVSISGMGKGTELWLPAQQFVQYAVTAEFDSPFYVFQKKFIKGQHDALFEDYRRSDLFSSDLWDLSPKLRDSFAQNRFFCLGGERTGSGLHVDPHFTGAWNTLLCGEKRWVLFPPGTSPQEIGVPSGLKETLESIAVYWWHDWYPKLAEEATAARLGMREVVQRAGETIFVPAGWWHTVLNEGWTIAVTENAFSPQTLARVWPELKADRRRAGRLVRAIRRNRPDLLPINEASGDTVESEASTDEDDFRMW